METNYGAGVLPVTGSDGIGGNPLKAKLYHFKNAVQSDEAKDAIADVMLAAFGRNYVSSGLHTHGGQLLEAVSVRGAPGNVIIKGETGVRVGIDAGAIRNEDGFPYARAAIRGRRAVSAVNSKWLRFYSQCRGHWVRKEKVQKAPPHRVFFLRIDDIAKVNREYLKAVKRKLK